MPKGVGYGAQRDAMRLYRSRRGIRGVMTDEDAKKKRLIPSGKGNLLQRALQELELARIKFGRRRTAK